MEVGRRLLQGLRLLETFRDLLALRNIPSGNLTVVRQQLLEVLRAEDVDLGQEQLTLNQSSVAVVQDGPDRDKVLKLATSLLNNTVLSGQDDGHARQVFDLGVAHDERVNVEAAGSKNTREPGQDTRFVLDQAIEDMALGRLHGRGRGLVEDVGHGSLGGPGWRRVGYRQRSRTVSQSFVGDGRGRAVGRVVSNGTERAPGGSGRDPADGCAATDSERGHSCKTQLERCKWCACFLDCLCARRTVLLRLDC